MCYKYTGFHIKRLILLSNFTHNSSFSYIHVVERVLSPVGCVTLSAASFRASLCRTRSVNSDKLGVIGELRL